MTQTEYGWKVTTSDKAETLPRLMRERVGCEMGATYTAAKSKEVSDDMGPRLTDPTQPCPSKRHPFSLPEPITPTIDTSKSLPRGMEDPVIMKAIWPPNRWRLPWRRMRRDPPLEPTAQAGSTGIEETYRPEHEALFDIVCVHGFEGNPKGTWTTIDKELWPGPSLANQLPKCRMLTYGYKISQETLLDTPLEKKIGDLATKLLEDVGKDRENSTPNWNPSRPIVFVAHGLGGLICQHATTFINGPDHLKNTARLVYGVMLLATPHSHAGLAQWAAISARSMGLAKKDVVSIRKKVENDVKHIVERQRLFREMVESPDNPSETSESSRIKVVSFFEAREPWKDSKAVIDDQRISPEFAITAYSKPIQAHGISDEHRGLANFEVEGGASGFGALAEELSRWSQQMESSTDRLSKSSTGNELTPITKAPPYQDRLSR